jgi:hypothetical protein
VNRCRPSATRTTFGADPPDHLHGRLT